MRITLTFSITKMTQIMLTFLLLYVLVYTQRYGAIPYFLQGCTLVCIILMALMYVKKPFPAKRYIPKELYCWWALLSLYSIIVGLFVAKDVSYLISQVFTFISFLFVCIMCIVICEEKQSYKWLLHVLVVIALLCSFFTLYHGYVGINEGEIYRSMSIHNNPNDLGITMIIGILVVIMLTNESKHKILCMFAIILFLYIIVLSSSRKSLIVGAAIVVVWLIYAQRDIIKTMPVKKKIGYIVFCIFVLGVGGLVVPKYYITSGSYGRMVLLFQNGISEGGRDKLFADSINLFVQHPFFGIGYKQYEVWSSSGLYSHSTYGEALACLGVFGSFLFFFPLVKSWIYYAKRIIIKKMTYEDKIFFLIITAIFVLGIGIIINYDLLILLAISIVFMRQNDSLYEKNEYESIGSLSSV